MKAENATFKIFIGGSDKSFNAEKAISLWKLMGMSMKDTIKHAVSYAYDQEFLESYAKLWEETPAMTIENLIADSDAEVRSSVFIFFKPKHMVKALDMKFISEDIVPYTMYTWQETDSSIKRYKTPMEHNIKLYRANVKRFCNTTEDVFLRVAIFKDVSTDREFVVFVPDTVPSPKDAIAWMAKGPVAFRHGEVLFRSKDMKAKEGYMDGAGYFKSLVLEA